MYKSFNEIRGSVSIMFSCQMVTITRLLLCEQENFYDALKYFLKLYLLLLEKKIFCTLIRQEDGFKYYYFRHIKS